MMSAATPILVSLLTAAAAAGGQVAHASLELIDAASVGVDAPGPVTVEMDARYRALLDGALHPASAARRVCLEGQSAYVVAVERYPSSVRALASVIPEDEGAPATAPSVHVDVHRDDPRNRRSGWSAMRLTRDWAVRHPCMAAVVAGGRLRIYRLSVAVGW